MQTLTRHDRLAQITSHLDTPIGSLHLGSQEPATALQTRPVASDNDKRLTNLAAAFDRFGISDGAVLSFHHHYRNGDHLMNAVLALAAQRGLRNLTIAPSSVFPVHSPLVEHIQTGVITAVVTDYAKGPAADALMSEALSMPTVLQSHGGRARAISSGKLHVDVAFVGASLAQANGACTGRGGALPCGPLGYAMVDAAYAAHTCVCAHEIVTTPLPHIDIPSGHVDAVIPFPDPGDVSGIASDTTLPSQSPEALHIGDMVAQVIKAAGMLRDGLSLQTGAGGYSLAAVPIIGAAMAEERLRGSFLSGGITGAHVDLLNNDLFERIHDVQCFDMAAVRSSVSNPHHHPMSASEYASPIHPNPIVERLDVMVLGAIEIDRDFNVNVTFGGDGRLMGGPGGHPDAAQGAKLTIVTTGLNAGGYPKVVENVRCVTTAGKDIDVLVTDHGIAVNSNRETLKADLLRAGLPVVSFDTLKNRASQKATKATATIVARPRVLLEHRGGGLLGWG